MTEHQGSQGFLQVMALVIAGGLILRYGPQYGAMIAEYPFAHPLEVVRGTIWFILGDVIFLVCIAPFYFMERREHYCTGCKNWSAYPEESMEKGMHVTRRVCDECGCSEEIDRRKPKTLEEIQMEADAFYPSPW